jgi:hypothetical protein
VAERDFSEVSAESVTGREVVDGFGDREKQRTRLKINKVKEWKKMET